MPKYPEIEVQLTGHDGNAFAIIGKCLEAMRRAGISKAERDKFQNEATSNNYAHLLATCLQWFDIS